MDTRSRPFLRALRLLWSRLGSGRIYVAAAAAVLLIFAVIGLVHLLSPIVTTRSKQIPAPRSSKQTADASPAATQVAQPMIAITELGSTETKDRKGQVNVAVRIGVTPRPNIKKGEVEIRVLFFDVTPSGEMRPTDAQVDYQWLTPVRDWADPSPKYLVATYLGQGPSRRAADNTRYGGFLVRVYFDGQLQAEQSEPKGLVMALRGQAPSSAAISPSATSPNVAVATPSSVPRSVSVNPSQSRVVTNEATPGPSSVQADRDSASAIPYASPVPDKPGFVYSPYNPKFLIDVRGFPPGTEVKDPNTGKLLKVP